MNPAEFAVGRPRLILLSACALVVYGILSYQALPRQENPTITERFARVTTHLPGAEPEKVELLISQVIEDHVSELDDIEAIFSNSTFGVSFVQIEVKRTARIETRLQEVREKVQQAAGQFPEDASTPQIDLRPFRTNTMILALAAQGMPLRALRQHARDLRRALESLPGVRRVELVGLPEEEIGVDVDLWRMSQRGITLSSVIDALARRNVQLPSGELDVGPLRSGVRTSGAFANADEVAQTLLSVGEGGLPVRLGDISSVLRRPSDPNSVVYYRGERAVGLGIEMMPGSSAVRLGERVRRLAAGFAANLPAGMAIHVVADEPTYVAERIGLLTETLCYGLALVVGLTLVGMGWRSGAVISLTIPLALAVSMGLQGLVGIPLHQLSIAALVIAIGIVVDESIVVVDNIQRHVDLGRPPREAAIVGLGEIHLAILAGAATTVASFIPLMVMSGDVGDFIRSIPIVVTMMLVGSVGVVHFVTPLLAVLAHRSSRPRPPRQINILELRYAPISRFATRRPGTVLVAFGCLFIVALGLIGATLWPPTFFPDADRHQFLVKVELPSGAALDETARVVRAIEDRLALDRDVLDWGAFVGAPAPKFYYNELQPPPRESVAQIVVNTDPSVPFERTRDIASRVEGDLRSNVAGARIRAQVLRQGYAGGNDVDVFVLGDDIEVLRLLAARISLILRNVPGVRSVTDSFGYDPITIQAHVEQGRANLLGLSNDNIALVLRTAVDGVVATTLRERDEEIPIRVRARESQRRSISALSLLPLPGPDGTTAPLAHVAQLAPGWSTQAIPRYNRKREAMITADLAPGHPLISVAARVRSAIQSNVRLPPGYTIELLGQHEEATESFLSLAKAAVAAVFLIYIVLVLRFQSLLQPALILLAIPMALVGASLGLAATGNPLSFMAFLGMISLAGIAVNDSIVLVDTINRVRRNGATVVDAVRFATGTRVRAVLMTSATTMVGLLPLSLSGGEFWAPFGFAMIFGLLGSTVLTLLVQPAAYLSLERLRNRVAGEAGKAAAPGAAGP